MVIIDGYPIDCAKVIDHSLDADVVQEPVESSRMISDHVQVMPPRLTIEGWVSDTPIGPMVQIRASSALLSALTTGSRPNPTDESFARLEAIHAAREPVVVETDLKRWDSMILRSLSVPQDAATGDALMFRAEFVQVQIVQNERSVVRVSVPRGSKKKNLGHKASDLKGEPPPAYLLADPETDPRFVGANSGGRKLVSFGGGEGASTRVPIASGGSGL